MTNSKKTNSPRYKTVVIYTLVVVLSFIGSQLLDLTGLELRTRQIINMASSAILILVGVGLYLAPIFSAKRKYRAKQKGGGES